MHPLADWDEKRVWAYIKVNEIPYNPLHEAGYRSIGCIPCTRPITADEEERAGRWAGSDKLECGITARHQGGHDLTTSTVRAEATCRDGFTLWFTGLSGSGKTTIAELVGPELERRGSSSSTSTATTSARTSRRGSASRRRTATRTSSASAGSPRA